ncbi:MAG: hypothetical protein F6J86_23800 [Symploca sp. SIO1B1]|nr:hypothetical protein [Symploca sp. SIO1C2]NER96835.1 hypothetical protein [Symploca sp. SIO1B1]
MSYTDAISDKVLQSIHMSETEFLREVAIMLFQQERFTLGQASHLARKLQGRKELYSSRQGG